MKNNKTLLSLAVIFVWLVLTASFTFASTTLEYKNITMNEITMEVPENNVTVNQTSEYYSIYNDTDNNIQIIVFNNEDYLLKDSEEMTNFTNILNENQIDAQLVEENEISYNKSESLEEYTYLTNYDDKNVFIITKDEETLKHMIETINKEDDTSVETQNNENSKVTTTSKTKESTSSANKQVVKSSSDDGVYFDEELNEYFDKNDRTVRDGQAPKGTSKAEIKQSLSSLDEETYG